MARLQGHSNFDLYCKSEITFAHFHSFFWTAGSIAMKRYGAGLSKYQVSIVPTVLSFANYTMARNFAMQSEGHCTVCNTLEFELRCMWRLHELGSYSIHNMFGHARLDNFLSSNLASQSRQCSRNSDLLQTAGHLDTVSVRNKAGRREVGR